MAMGVWDSDFKYCPGTTPAEYDYGNGGICRCFPNYSGWSVPATNWGGGSHQETNNTFQRGLYMVNLSGVSINTYDPHTMVRNGSIGSGECCVWIGDVGNYCPHTVGGQIQWWSDYYFYVGFTGPSGQPWIGLLYATDFNKLSSFRDHAHGTCISYPYSGDKIFKTYNRTINFYGTNYAPGTRVVCGDAMTTDLSSFGQANNIIVKGIANSAGELLIGGGDEWCSTNVLYHGTYCDVEGYW